MTEPQDAPQAEEGATGDVVEAPARPMTDMEVMGAALSLLRSKIDASVGLALILFPPAPEGEPPKPIWGCTVPMEQAQGVLEAVLGSMYEASERAAAAQGAPVDTEAEMREHVEGLVAQAQSDPDTPPPA